MGTFSYTPELRDPLSMVRMLIADTQEFAADGTTPAFVFSDDEIAQAFALQASLLTVHVIGGGFGGVNAFPQAYPPLPVSPLRAAALLMDALASNQARLQSVTKLLDVSLSPLTAKDMRAQADAWRKLDDESGAFLVVEQVTTTFAFRDRWFGQWARNGQGVVMGGG